MRNQIVAFVRKFESALFPKTPLNIITTGNVVLPAMSRPLVFVPNIRTVNPVHLSMIKEEELPPSGPFYVLFHNQIDAYLKYAHQYEPPVNPTLTLWSLCISVCWKRAQHEQVEEARPKISKWSHLEHLLLTSEELVYCVAPFQGIDEQQITDQNTKRALEIWPTYGNHWSPAA